MLCKNVLISVILPQTAVEEHKEAQQNGDFDMSTGDE